MARLLQVSTTDHKKDDRSQVKDLTKNIKTRELLRDSGHDRENIYKMLRKKVIKPTIRLPNNIAAKKTKTTLQHSAAYQQNKGYHPWRNKNKYGRRESVEYTFFRFKNSFSSKFLSRNEDNLKNKMTTKFQLLNKMFKIDKPKSIRIT